MMRLLALSLIILGFQRTLAFRKIQHNVDLSCRTVSAKRGDGLPFPVLYARPENTERAGTDGYSVLRQPLQWDLEETPAFDAPTTLREKDDPSQNPDTWLTTNADNRVASVFRSADNPNKPKPNGRSKKLKKERSARQVDLFQRTFDVLDYDIVLDALMQETSTFPAQELVAAAKLASTATQPKAARKKASKLTEEASEPLMAESLEGSQSRYRGVKEMMLLGSQDTLVCDAAYVDRKGYKQDLGYPPITGTTFDLRSILQIADDGKVLEGPDILEIVVMIDAFEEILLWKQGLDNVDGVDFVELPRLAGFISRNETLHHLLRNAFDEEGKLSGTTFPAIGRLRTKIMDLKSEILLLLNEVLSTDSVKSKLALESGGALYSEVNGRIVIPIDKKGYSSSLGIIHDTSRSGKTVFLEPTEIVGPTNDLKQAESELRAEEARVWRSLTEQVLANREALETSVMAVGQLDLAYARMQLGNNWDGVIPESGSNRVISLRNARHPVLILREVENLVGSDIDIGADDNQGLILSGPNSGGKTIVLKLVGLMALLARNGIPVPADRSTPDHVPRVDFFDPILADIGDLQSSIEDLSTFSGHMLVCREVLANSGEAALILMDEVGSGTDPNQGVAIAQALLEAILETGARVVITTHFLQLKQLAAADPRFVAGAMQFINGRPTYKLELGAVGESFALSVAERLNLPPPVLDRAKELLNEETRQLGELIREMEDQKVLIDEQVEELAKQKKEMKRMELKMRSEQVKIEQKQLSARRDEAKKFAKRLEEKERVLEDVLEKLKQNPSKKVLAKSWQDIRIVKKDAMNEAENIKRTVAAVQGRQTIREIIEQQELERPKLIPISELAERPKIEVGDTLTICKGRLFGREIIVTKVNRAQVRARINGKETFFRFDSISLGKATPEMFAERRQAGLKTGNARSRALELALEKDREMSAKQVKQSPIDTMDPFRTRDNTVNVLGCNFSEAKEKVQRKLHQVEGSGRKVVYVLHGHGEAGILKSKIRNWVKNESGVSKAFSADLSDGGDAFTRVELNH